MILNGSFLRQQLARSSTGVAMLVIGFANLGLSLLTAVVMARTLPASNYGQYLFAFNIANIASLPIELGLPTLMMREIARNRASENDKRLFALIIWVLAFLTGSFLIVGSGFLLFLEFGEIGNKIPPGLQLWTLLLLFPLALMNWARGVLLGFEKPIKFALPDSIFRPVLLLMGVSACAYLGFLSPTIAMACHVGAVAICFVWTLYQAWRTLRANRIAFQFDRTQLQVRAWINSLIPITLISGVSIINRRIDILMIGLLSTTTAVAGYNVAMQMTSLILMAQTVLNSTIGPRAAFAHEKGDRESMQRSLAPVTLVSTTFALCAVLGLVLLGPLLIKLTFGKAYLSSYPVVLILCVGQLFSAMMGPTALILNMSREEKKTLRTGIIACIASVSLNALLIPQFFAIGAAIASSTTFIIIQSQRWWMVRRQVGIRTDVFAAARIMIDSHRAHSIG